MSFDTCWFAARASGEAKVAVLRRRAEELSRFYGSDLLFTERADCGLVLGAIGRETFTWGSADDGPGAVAVPSESCTRLRTAAIDVASLYEASGRAWSTHAVAAAHWRRGASRCGRKPLPSCWRSSIPWPEERSSRA